MKNAIVLLVLATAAVGCGDPIVDNSYEGPPVALVSGIMPALEGMVAAHPARIEVRVLNSDRLANSAQELGQVRAASYPATFTFPITVARDVGLRAWTRGEAGDPISVILYGLSVTASPEDPTEEEAIALDDFIAHAVQPNDNQINGLASASDPVRVPLLYSHVRRPCINGVPGPAEVFPLDGKHAFTFTAVPRGVSWDLRVRAASCASLPLPLPPPTP